MFLLRLHISISILLLLTGEGISIVLRELVIKNGWKVSKGIEGIVKLIKWCPIYFIPLINLMAVLATFIQLTIKKEDFDNWRINNEKQ